MGSAVRKHILNNSKLIEINVDDRLKGGWILSAPQFEYHYFDVKVAHVTFNGSKCEVNIHEVFNPWAYVSNDNGEFFCKMSRVEDQLHGVNIIEMDNLQALFIEREINLNLKAGLNVLTEVFNGSKPFTAQQFAQSVQANAIQAQQSMMNYTQQAAHMKNAMGAAIWANTTKTTVANVSKKKFPFWSRKK